MSGPHVAITIEELRGTLHNDVELQAAVARELYRLALLTKVEPAWMLSLMDGVVKEIRAHTARMQADPENYPGRHVNVLAIQVTPPKAGKVGASTFEQKVRV